VPTTKAITRTRRRLGAEPLRQLFVEVARPLATQGTQGAWYRGWQVLAIDGTTLDVPHSPADQHAFGRPATHRGERTAFPQVRVLGLAECGTHAIITRCIALINKATIKKARVQRCLELFTILPNQRRALWFSATLL
jgi:hypothetical protein